METSYTARLKGAEILVRGGHFDRAIEECQRLVREHPGDAAAALLLADIYVRSADTDNAIQLLAAVGDALYAARRLSEARLVYTKLLHLRADDQRALLRSGEIAVAEGRFADARAYFTAGEDRLLAHGDVNGAAGVRARLDRLALVDVEAHLDLARNRSGVGVTYGEDTRPRRVPTEPPALSDQSSRTTPQQARDENQEFRLRASLARVFVARGDAIGAAEYLTTDMADGDPLLLLAIAEIQLRGGKLDRGVTLVERIIADHPSLIHAASRLGAEVAPYAPDAGFLLVEMAVTVWEARSEWRAAADALEAFVAAVPDHAAALIRLTEMNAAAARHASAEHAATQAGVEQTVILSFRPQAAAKSKKHA